MVVPVHDRRQPAVATQQVVWDETPCLLCGGDDAAIVLEAADPLPGPGYGLRFAVVRCRRCGLTYTNPRPDAASIAHFYPPDYGPHAFRMRRPPRSKPLWWSWLFGRPCPERRGRLPLAPPGRLLDFGCGSGQFLHRMQQLGWETVGLDICPVVVHNLQKRGYTVWPGTLPHPRLVPQSFDIVTMWQSLEHVHHPRRILREVYQLLKPGGYVIIAVPNFASWPARWFGPWWYALDLPRHLVHFTPQTLRQMLQAERFHVRSLRGIIHANWLRGSAARYAAAGGTGWRCALQSKPLAEVTAWLCYVAGRAECLLAVAQKTVDADAAGTRHAAADDACNLPFLA